MNRKIFISLVGVLSLFAYIRADILPEDSDNFTYKYEADVLPMDATPAWARTTSGAVSNSVSDGILSVDTNGDAAYQLYYKDPNWGGMDPYNDGFTIETSIKINASGVGKKALYLQFGDGQSYAEIQITDTAIIWNGTSGFTMKAINTTAQFNVIRVAKDAVNSTYQVWLGDEQIGTDLAGKAVTTVDRFWIGDWSSSIQGAYEVDYIRTTSGAYSPVPEPATMCLLGLGIAGMIVRKRR